MVGVLGNKVVMANGGRQCSGELGAQAHMPFSLDLYPHHGSLGLWASKLLSWDGFSRNLTLMCA